MNEIIKKNSSKFGLIMAGLMISYTLLAYIVDEGLFVNMILGIFLIIGSIAIFVISAVQIKKGLGGYITFKEAFSGFMLTYIIYAVVTTVFSILLFNFIDPDFAERLKDLTLEKSVEMMESFGMTEEQITTSLADQESVDKFSIGSQFKSFLMGIVMYSILGLITAAVIKKNRPEFPDMEVDDFGSED